MAFLEELESEGVIKLPPKQMNMVQSGIPGIEIYRKNKWGYMITLKSGAMSAVWDDAVGIMKLEKKDHLFHASAMPFRRHHCFL